MTKVFVVADYAPPCKQEYITPGKRYYAREVGRTPRGDFAFVNRRGLYSYAFFRESSWLNGGNWRVIVQPPTRRISMEEYRAMEGVSC